MQGNIQSMGLFDWSTLFLAAGFVSLASIGEVSGGERGGALARMGPLELRWHAHPPAALRNAAALVFPSGHVGQV